MRTRLFTALSILILASGCCRTRNVEAWLVDPLATVFPDDPAGSNTMREATFAAARRSYVSLQLALRSSAGIGDLYVDAQALNGPGMPIDRIQVRRVEYVVATTNTPDSRGGGLLRKAPALFPDALLTSFPMTVEKNKTRAVWITIPIPADQTPGRYNGVLALRQGSEKVSEIPYSLDLTKATVPEDLTIDVALRLKWDDGHMQQFFRAPRFSNQWWIVAGNVARFLAPYHQTFIPAPPMDLVEVSVSGGALRYDFSNYVRFVRTFENAGVRLALDGGQLLSHGTRKCDPPTLRIWTVEEGRAVERHVAATNPRGQAFLESFYGSLRKVLAANKWEQRYVQGLLDSPSECEAEVCAQLEREIRRLLPAAGVAKDAGSGSYIDHPLVETRTLGWHAYQQGARTRFRWEANRWSPDPFKDTQPAFESESGFPPPGGAHLTYPNRDGRTLFSSIRLEQLRESVEDYGLLVELSRRNPAKARELALRAATPGPARDLTALRIVLRELLNAF